MLTTTVRIPAAKKDLLKIIAGVEKREIKDILTELIDEYLERHKETLEILSKPDWVNSIKEGLNASAKGETVRWREKNWEIVLTKSVEKVYDKSILTLQRRIDKSFEELEKNPIYGRNVKPLTGELKGLFRYRVGDWRIINRVVKENMIVEIIAILPRGKAY